MNRMHSLLQLFCLILVFVQNFGGSSALASPINMVKLKRMTTIEGRYDGYDVLRGSSKANDEPIENQNIFDSKTHNIITQMKLRSGKLPSSVWNGIQSNQELGTTIALFATYFTVMASKCALPTTMSILIGKGSGMEFSGDPHQQMARVLSLSTFAVAVGKILLGPIIDKFGGILCLKVALSALAALQIVIASCNNFSTFAVSWVFVDFVFSSCWAACLNAIHRTFSDTEWAKQIGWLAVAARSGNALSFLIFASILQWSKERNIVEPWRLIFLVSSVLQALPLVMLHLVRKPKSEVLVDENNDMKNTRSSIQLSLKVLRDEAQKLPFWMHFISRSCLMLIASFLLFVPSYMTNCFGMSDGEAARSASAYAVGCLISISAGSKRFARLQVVSKIKAIICLLGTLFACSLFHVAHITGRLQLSAFAGVASMFIWGFTFAIPFYIPSSMYALQKGARESSATSKCFTLLQLISVIPLHCHHLFICDKLPMPLILVGFFFLHGSMAL